LAKPQSAYAAICAERGLIDPALMAAARSR
jgi:hypothetical protein